LNNVDRVNGFLHHWLGLIILMSVDNAFVNPYDAYRRVRGLARTFVDRLIMLALSRTWSDRYASIWRALKRSGCLARHERQSI